MSRTSWMNVDCHLFLIKDEGHPLFLYRTGIRRLEIRSRYSTERWVCKHCGGYIESGSMCSYCNAPLSKDVKSALAMMECTLPWGLDLVDLNKNFVLEVQYKDYGDPAEYIEDNVIVRMFNCEVRNKWIPNFMLLNGWEEAEILRLHVEISCNVEFCNIEKWL